MTREPINQPEMFPVHCAVCINLGRFTPAEFSVKGGLMACAEHADQLELFGLEAVKANTTRRAT